MNSTTPLSLIIENAKTHLTKECNNIIENYQLPAFLMEGIVLDLLAEVRKQKTIEIMSDITRMYNNSSEKGETS